MNEGKMPRAWSSQKYRKVVTTLMERFPNEVKGVVDFPLVKVVEKKKRGSIFVHDPGPYDLVPGKHVSNLEVPAIVWARPLDDEAGPWWPGLLVPETYRHYVRNFKKLDRHGRDEAIVLYFEAPSQYLSLY
jgi:hypothetical protein